MPTLIFIALGGSFGALSRYGLTNWFNRVVNSPFPWGTLVINLTGSFLIGFFFILFDRSVLPAPYRNLVSVGFLGAYTTFSTYSLETINLLREGQWRLASSNILVSNILGIVLVILGMYCAKLLLKTLR